MTDNVVKRPSITIDPYNSEPIKIKLSKPYGQKAIREAAEEMRERCAEYILAHPVLLPDELAVAIRALEIGK